MSAAAATDVVLRTQALCKQFGGITATDHVSFSLAAGARHALIGPNGAGKTTLVNLLTGVLAPSSGRIELHGSDITRLAPHERVRRGLVRTFQINQLFASMTPREALALAASEQLGLGWNALARLGRQPQVCAGTSALLADMRLGDVADTRTEQLPYGKRRLLEIALALARRPRVLLLDEPVAGVPGAERREILDTLARLPADMAIVLIEHDMDVVFGFARSIGVLVNGGLLTEGEPAAIAADPRVKSVYLGQAPLAAAAGAAA
jgi:branched-chain amino acid transport system ATP-binding protein